MDSRSQSIIDRLGAVDLANPRFEKDRVETALLAHFAALGIEPLPVRWADDAESAYSMVFEAAESAARSAARSAAESAAGSAAGSAAWSAAGSAAESAAWSAAWSAAALEKYFGIWVPFVDAFEAGLWLFFPTAEALIAVPRPVLHVQGERLHCEHGPAVYWPSGKAYWFLNGVQMEREIVETPSDELDARLIFKATNAEIRREIVRKIGIERCLVELGSSVLDSAVRHWPARRYLATPDDGLPSEVQFIEYPERNLKYELVALNLGDGGKRPYLRMSNPSIDAVHIEGVPPQIQTVEEALRWRDGLDAYEIGDDGEDWYQQGDVLIFPAGATRVKPQPTLIT